MRITIAIMMVLFAASFLFIGCDEDPLGLEKNVLVSEISDETPDDTSGGEDVPQTVFGADSIVMNFFELSRSKMRTDTNVTSWTHVILDSSASVDTSSSPFTINMNLVLGRNLESDTINSPRLERIVRFDLRLTETPAFYKYRTMNDNRFIQSKVYVQDRVSGKTTIYHGKYPLTLYFEDPIIRDDHGLIRFTFLLNVPLEPASVLARMMFTGEVKIYYSFD